MMAIPLEETGFLTESLVPAAVPVGTGTYVGGSQGSTFSNAVFSYDVLARENWSSIGGILFICLLIGFIIAIVLSNIFRLSLTFTLCIIVIMSAIMMILLGDNFVRNAGVFILSGVLITMILTLFIFFMNDLIRGDGKNGGSLGDTADIL